MPLNIRTLSRAKRKKDTKSQITVGRIQISAKCLTTGFEARSGGHMTQSEPRLALVQHYCVHPTGRSLRDRKSGSIRSSVSKSFYGMLIRSIGAARGQRLFVVGLSKIPAQAPSSAPTTLIQERSTTDICSSRVSSKAASPD